MSSAHTTLVKQSSENEFKEAKSVINGIDDIISGFMILWMIPLICIIGVGCFILYKYGGNIQALLVDGPIKRRIMMIMLILFVMLIVALGLFAYYGNVTATLICTVLALICLGAIMYLYFKGRNNNRIELRGCSYMA